MTRLMSLSIAALLLVSSAAFAPSSAFAVDEASEGRQEKPQSPTPTPNEPSQAGTSSEPEIKVSLKDGVHFKSADGNFDIILGGYVGIHYRVVANRPDELPNSPAANLRSSPDGWYIRQARPELSGFIYKDFDFRVQLDFPTGPAAIDGTIQDCYAGWRYFPEFSLRVGQFKEPFGQEQTTPDRFLDFNERSEGDRFTPARELGAMAYGTIGGGIFTYEAGFYNGQGRAVLEINKGKEEAVRLRVQPFAGAEEGSLFKSFRLGVAGTHGGVEKGAITAFTSPSSYLSIIYLTVPANAANVLDGPRTRGGAELTWSYGPVGLRGEAWRRVDTVDTATVNHEKLTANSWNAEVSWLVTGEKKPIEGRVLPSNPFDPRTGGWGAVEVAARVDRLHLDDDLFSLGIAPAAGNANVVTGYSAGVNWYLTRNIRISPNVYWETFDDPILFANGRLDRHFFGGILRFQLEF